MLYPFPFLLLYHVHFNSGLLESYCPSPREPLSWWKLQVSVTSWSKSYFKFIASLKSHHLFGELHFYTTLLFTKHTLTNIFLLEAHKTLRSRQGRLYHHFSNKEAEVQTDEAVWSMTLILLMKEIRPEHRYSDPGAIVPPSRKETTS